MNFGEPYEILVNRLAHWIQLTLDYLPNTLVAVVVILFFYTLAKWISRLFKYFVQTRMESKTAIRLLTFFLKFFIILWGIYLAFEIMGFHEAIISLLAGAGLMGLVLGLAFQELITNVISGVSLTLKKYFHLGDEVSIGTHRGFVSSLDLRATILRGLDGETIVIPNKDVLQSAVTNYYTSGSLRKDLYIGIPLTEDFGRITEILKEAGSNLDFLNQYREIEVHFIEVVGPIMKLVFRYWVLYPIAGFSDGEEEHFAIMSIKKTFEKYQVPVPTYIRTDENEFLRDLEAIIAKITL